MQSNAQEMNGVARLIAVLPPVAFALGRTAVTVARWESRMIRATLEEIIWDSHRDRCSCPPRIEWRISCEPPCHRCHRHG